MEDFLQEKTLSNCEIVHLWSLIFPLSKETPFKEAPVLICIHCSGAGDSCGGVFWADSHFVGVYVDTMQKTKLWWFIKCFLVCRSLFPPFLPFLWPGKGQEENGRGVEEGTVAVVAGSPNKGRNTTVCLKRPKQSHTTLRYASSAPCMWRWWGGVLSSRAGRALSE